MNKKMSFEEAMERLEEIVRKLEDGTMPLDASMEAFEEAVSLSRFCTESLEQAKQRVRMLTKDPDGSVTDLPFDTADAT